MAAKTFFEREEGVPLYILAANALRAEIKSGGITPGTKLSQRRLSEKLSVSKKTVSDALSILEAEGLVISKPKSGTFVNGNLWLLLIKKDSPDWSRLASGGAQMASPDGIYSIMKDISSDPVIHISGPTISNDFKYYRPIRKALEKVSRRLESTNDLNSKNIMGLPSLRETVAAHMERCGVYCSPEQIMITQGSTESLAAVFLSFLRRGMRLYCETPSMLNSMTLAQTLGALLEKIPMDEEGISAEKLANAVRKGGGGMLYCNPVNQYPTGISTSKRRRDAIMTICAGKGIPVIENDMLRDFYIEKPNPKPMKAFDKNGSVIYIGSLMGAHLGMKISWVIAPDFLMKRICDVKCQFEIIANTIAQMTADELLKNGWYYEYMEEYRPVFAERIRLCGLLFEKYFSGIATWEQADNSCYRKVKFAEPVNTLKIYKKLKNIVALPGYFFDGGDTSHFFISPLADTARNLEEGIKAVAQCVRSTYGL